MRNISLYRTFPRRYRYLLAAMLTGALLLGALLMLLLQARRDVRVREQEHARAVARWNRLSRIQLHFDYAVRTRLMAQSATDSPPGLSLIGRIRAADLTAIEELNAGVAQADTAEEAALLDRLRQDWQELSDASEQALAAAKVDPTGAEATRLLRQSEPLSERIRFAIMQLTRSYDATAQKRLDFWQAGSARAVWRLGTVVGTLLLLAGGVFLFLHQRRLAEADRSARLLHSVIDSLSEPVLVLDRAGYVSMLNTAGAVRLGRRADEVIDRQLAEAVPSLRESELLQAVAEVTAATGSRILSQNTLTSDGGGDYEIRVSHCGEGVAVFARDVSRLRRIEQAIRRSEGSFREYFLNSPLPMIVCDQKTLEILEVNDQFVKLYGYAPDELTSLLLTELGEAEGDGKWLMKLTELRAGAVISVEARHRRRNGEAFHAEIKAGSLSDQQRQIAVAIIQDITARKRVESALHLRESQLRESQHFNDQVISSTCDGILVADHWMRCVLWNRKMEEITGIPAAQALGFSLRDNLPGLSQEDLAACHRQALKGEFVTSPDFPGIQGGSERLLSATFTPNRSLNGEVIGTIALVSDVTERRRAETALRESQEHLRENEQKYRLLWETTPDAVVLMDADSLIHYANPAVLNVFGWQPGELTGRSLDILQPEHLRGLHRAGLQRYLASGQKKLDWRCVEVPALHRAGHQFPVEISFSHMQINGRHWFAGFMQDISARKAAETAQRKVAERLASSNRALQDFAYIASHDLQEPLRKISTFGDRLQKKYAEVLAGDGRDYLERMQNAAGRMQVLIRDLLDYSRVMSRQRACSRIDLAALTREVLSDLEVQIERLNAGVSIISLPEIEADPTQMRQLLQNLIGNALKFHKPDVAPQVTISSEPLPCPDGGPQAWRISVSDNGIGFEDKYQDRIFGVFQRLHGREHYEGTGVGLAVVRKIVERHGGEIAARSSPGQGATFIITLPAVQPQSAGADCDDVCEV